MLEEKRSVITRDSRKELEKSMTQTNPSGHARKGPSPLSVWNSREVSDVRPEQTAENKQDSARLSKRTEIGENRFFGR